MSLDDRIGGFDEGIPSQPARHELRGRCEWVAQWCCLTQFRITVFITKSMEMKRKRPWLRVALT